MKHQRIISDVPFLWASQHPLLSQGGQRLHLGMGDFTFQDPQKNTELWQRETKSENGRKWMFWKSIILVSLLRFHVQFQQKHGNHIHETSECETIDSEDAATTTCLEKSWHPWHPLIPVLRRCSAPTVWVQILQHSCQSDTIPSMSPIDHPIYEDSWHMLV